MGHFWNIGETPDKLEALLVEVLRNAVKTAIDCIDESTLPDFHEAVDEWFNDQMRAAFREYLTPEAIHLDLCDRRLVIRLHPMVCEETIATGEIKTERSLLEVIKEEISITVPEQRHMYADALRAILAEIEKV